MLCYFIGVIVNLRDFSDVAYAFWIWMGGLKVDFLPVRTLLGLYAMRPRDILRPEPIFKRFPAVQRNPCHISDILVVSEYVC